MDGLDFRPPAKQFRAVEDFWRAPESRHEGIQGQNIVRAGSHNRELVMHHVRAKGAISRLELAELTGLTQAAVSKITKDLLAENWLFCKVIRDGSRGQPTSLLSTNPDAAFSIGINVDRDNITFIVLDFGGRVREIIRRDIAYAKPADVKQMFAECFQSLRHKQKIPSDAIVGIGVSLPDDFAQTVADPNLQAHWHETSFATLFSSITDLPVVQENDGAAAAIGEMSFGAGIEVNSFFYIYISIGLGGGLVINRKYVRGSHGRSGELGYLPQINPFRSTRSSLGSTIGDAVSISGFFKTLTASGCPAAQMNDVDFKHPVVQSAVADWTQTAAELLYVPLLSTICILDPDTVLIGGQLPSFIIERLALEINKRLSMNIGVNWPDKAVRPGKATVHAAAIGAAVLAFREVYKRDNF